MRKLKLQIQMSVDGYVAGPNSELDRMTWDCDNKLKKYVNELTEPADQHRLSSQLHFRPLCTKEAHNKKFSDQYWGDNNEH